MKASLSKQNRVAIALAGHAGCGHCHSHNQYIQDDSGGLATVLALFQEATGLSLAVKEVRVKPGLEGYIEVETASGGIGRATSRRGITYHEALLCRNAEGREAICTQSLALEVFGRFYGQGIHETPVALQTAIANAALDTFARNDPARFHQAWENLPGSCGMMVGTVLEIEKVPVAVLGTVNASSGGIGPNENLEGNIYAGSKKELMDKLGMINLPCLVIEGKVYTPKFCDDLQEPTFLVRADPVADNPVVGRSLYKAAESLGYPCLYLDNVMVRSVGALARQTEELGDKIIAMAGQLKAAEGSRDKVEALANLAYLVSQEGGGISFMSNRLNDIVGGVGLQPGTAAVLSYLVTPEWHRENIFPYLTIEDVNKFVKIIKKAVLELQEQLPEAQKHLDKNSCRRNLDDLL